MIDDTTNDYRLVVYIMNNQSWSKSFSLFTGILGSILDACKPKQKRDLCKKKSVFILFI